MNAAQHLLAQAERHPERVLVEFHEQPLTAEAIARETLRLATGLKRRGVGPGDSVGVALPNIPQFVPLHFAIMLAGGVFVPLHVLLKGPEIAYRLRDSRVRVLVVFEMFLDSVEAALEQVEEKPEVFVVSFSGECGPFRPYEELLAEDGAVFEPEPADEHAPLMTLYTSGTTGQPKGAQISSHNLESMLRMFARAFPLEPGDKCLAVLPLFHVFGLNGLFHPAIRQGATVVLQPRFEAEPCIESLRDGGITMFAAVPTMYFYILKHPDVEQFRFPDLKYCISGGSAMPLEVMSQFEKRFDVPIYEGYGLTETTVCVCVNHPRRRKPGSIGPAFEELETAVVDESGNPLPDGEVGEIIVRGPTVMLGYLNKPDETAEVLTDGWFHTGDLGYRDEDGFFFLVDRKKDMINKAGFSIFPREIEEVLYQLPAIAEAAVIGVPDEARGEQVAAVLAFKPGQDLPVGQIHAHLANNLAKYKLPASYAFLPELPKGPTNKLLKRELKASWEKLEQIEPE